MRRLGILTFALFFLTLGCGREAETRKADPGRAEKPVVSIDFDRLYQRVDAFKTRDLEYFAAHWPQVRKDLNKHAKNRAFATLSNRQQERLWMSLDYLRSCRHPSILHKHGAEIVPIQLALDVPELNKELQEILQHNDQTHHVGEPSCQPGGARESVVQRLRIVGAIITGPRSSFATAIDTRSR